MIYRILSTCFCIVLVACENNKDSLEISEASLIASTIKELETDKEKRLFLENIQEEQSEIRKDIQKAERTYGRKSNHGHPSISKHGIMACKVPIFVMQFSNQTSLKEEMFPYLYDGYIHKNVDPSGFSEYLNRMHSLRYGERFRLPNPYREETMVKALIKKLDLKISPEKI